MLVSILEEHGDTKIEDFPLDRRQPKDVKKARLREIFLSYIITEVTV